MSRCILAIDQGTTGTTALLIDEVRQLRPTYDEAMGDDGRALVAAFADALPPSRHTSSPG